MSLFELIWRNSSPFEPVKQCSSELLQFGEALFASEDLSELIEEVLGKKMQNIEKSCLFSFQNDQKLFVSYSFKARYLCSLSPSDRKCWEMKCYKKVTDNFLSRNHSSAKRKLTQHKKNYKKKILCNKWQVHVEWLLFNKFLIFNNNLFQFQSPIFFHQPAYT